jgi:hypothetical protein
MGKTIVYAGVTVGGLIGGYVPVLLFHVSDLSLASIACGFAGAFLGLWVGYRIFRLLDL